MTERWEHKSERFAFGYVLYWLARSNRLQTGVSPARAPFFQNLCFSETLNDRTLVEKQQCDGILVVAPPRHEVR
uniref:Uncharacterized protein n=1 Tax=Candidatus Kentrum sp. SD TaxID=2126332 RepID=A0A450YPL7_9GAMM|nr:MAG: hypothetical protein BECKSD772F_GA0070984_102429 [Candidatus Kentron sp. SD]VFK43473.1 MAG: hypothetical protein BECKSD772E_GA0070983_10267 [Candidatus Kentron sp. SD]VFK80639.1 MAG: hypothetical protein BECKSD772D_GA0070982_11357 [Candidatus Kentron sp. SD]